MWRGYKRMTGAMVQEELERREAERDGCAVEIAPEDRAIFQRLAQVRRCRDALDHIWNAQRGATDAAATERLLTTLSRASGIDPRDIVLVDVASLATRSIRRMVLYVNSPEGQKDDFMRVVLLANGRVELCVESAY